MFKESQILRCYGAPKLSKIKISIWAHHFKLWHHQLKLLVMINNQWKVYADINSFSKVLSNLIMPSFVWKLFGIWDVAEMSDDSEVAKISKMINGKTMKFSKVLSNKNMLKLQSLVFIAFTLFELLKIYWALAKNDLIGLNERLGLKDGLKLFILNSLRCYFSLGSCF